MPRTKGSTKKEIEQFQFRYARIARLRRDMQYVFKHLSLLEFRKLVTREEGIPAIVVWLSCDPHGCSCTGEQLERLSEEIIPRLKEAARVARKKKKKSSSIGQ